MNTSFIKINIFTLEDMTIIDKYNLILKKNAHYYKIKDNNNGCIQYILAHKAELLFDFLRILCKIKLDDTLYDDEQTQYKYNLKLSRLKQSLQELNYDNYKLSMENIQQLLLKFLYRKYKLNIKHKYLDKNICDITTILNKSSNNINHTFLNEISMSIKKSLKINNMICNYQIVCNAMTPDEKQFENNRTYTDLDIDNMNVFLSAFNHYIYIYVLNKDFYSSKNDQPFMLPPSFRKEKAEYISYFKNNDPEEQDSIDESYYELDELFELNRLGRLNNEQINFYKQKKSNDVSDKKSND